MPLLDVMNQRKSVRNFIDKPVEREKLMVCLEAARIAPSATNSQPWKFIVVDDKPIKDKLCAAAFGGIYMLNSFCKKAPVIIVVVSERAKFMSRIGGMFRGTEFSLIDIGIACEHLVLQAVDQGLGTCWIGWFDEGAVKKVLNIPPGKKVAILIALGYYDPAKINPERNRDPLDKVSSFNSY
jgi:nitroreductase